MISALSCLTSSASFIPGSRAYNRFTMDNKQIARILRETAQPLEIEGAIMFNTPHFANPNTEQGTSGFGVISSDRQKEAGQRKPQATYGAAMMAS